MASWTLTANQQKTVVDLLDRTEAEQAAVATYTANLAAGQTRRDDAYVETVAGLDTIGLAGVPDPITEVHKELDADGNWTGKVYVNEALP